MAGFEVAQLFASLYLNSSGFLAGLGTAHKAVFNLKNALIGLGSTVGINMAASQFIKAARDAENYRQSLRTIIADTKEADATFDRVRAWAAVNPINTDDAVAGFVRLRTAAVENSEETLRAVADVATVMRRSVAEVANAVVTGEAEQLRQLGIIIEKGTKTAILQSGDVRISVNNDIQSIRRGIVDLMQQVFGGGMANAGDSFSGMLDTMGGMWIDFQQQLMGIGGDGGPFDAVKTGVRSIRDTWASWVSSGEYKTFILGVRQSVVSAINSIISKKDDLVAAVKAAYSWATENPNMSMGLAGFLILGPTGGAVTTAIGAVLDKVGSSWSEFLGSVTGFMAENPHLAAGGIIAYVLAGSAGLAGVTAAALAAVGTIALGMDYSVTGVSSMEERRGGWEKLGGDIDAAQEAARAAQARARGRSQASSALRADAEMEREVLRDRATRKHRAEALELAEAPMRRLRQIQSELEFNPASPAAYLAETQRILETAGKTTKEYQKAEEILGTIRQKLREIASQKFEQLTSSLQAVVGAAAGGHILPNEAIAMVSENMQGIVEQSRQAVAALTGIPESMKEGLVRARIEDYLKGLGLEIRKTTGQAFQVDLDSMLKGFEEKARSSRGFGFLQSDDQVFVSSGGKLLGGPSAMAAMPDIQRQLAEWGRQSATPGSELGAAMKTHQEILADNTAALRQLDESMRKRGEKPDGVTVTIGNVTVRDAHDAERVGRSLGSGVMTPGY